MVAARPSGTEDVYKIYAESFRSECHLRQIQQEAQNTIACVFGGVANKNLPPETQNARVWGANGRRVSRGRFRVVGCGAFRLGFDGGLGGEAENMLLFAPVVRQVLAQSQEPRRRQLDGLATLKDGAHDVRR